MCLLQVMFGVEGCGGRESGEGPRERMDGKGTVRAGHRGRSIGRSI